MTHADVIVPFLQENWIWIALLIATIAYYLFFEIQTLRYRRYMISPQEVVQLINKEDAQILDLRPKNFFEEAHVKGALNIDCNILLKENTPINFQKNKPLILFSGYESDGRKVLTIVKNQSFEKIYILTGGAQEWKKLNYPFVSSKTEKKSLTKKGQKKTSH